ncbi:hypothetical protein N431DRAFT_470490 [Stipitochalara longipes BDJ]|nr:hypothetical protein N431DRAFT_470490 [Stipitochalara longipes BDJ]
MDAASVAQSTTGTFATYAKRIGRNSRPDMDILLDNHEEGKIYTTLDALSGRVEITAPQNARFDEIQITLEGVVKTYVENLSPHTTRARTTAVHNFLRLTMPMRDADYPQPRIAEAGQTYKFPFNFVVPNQLLPRACSHKCNTEHVHNAHLQLPPSMGCREVSILDDLAPEMSKVMYWIKVKVLRNEEDGKDVVLAEKLRKLRIVPAQAELPPMNILTGQSDYQLTKTKTLRKGVFSGKLGKITVSATQPSAIILPSPSLGVTLPATAMATLNLRFDPHDKSSQPPRLGGLTTKIRATTFFAARPNEFLPSHTTMTAHFETVRGVYDTTVSLSSRCVEAVSWTKHKAAPAYTRRNSASSSDSSDCSDNCPEAKPGSEYYSATVLVPITLPTSKTWIPTFHSCIVSRTYSIDLNLSIHTPGNGVPASTVALHLPIQVAADGNQNEQAPMTAAEAAAELADAEEFLRPRVIEVPNAAHIGNSVLVPQASDLPPSYEDFTASQPQVVDPGRC